MNNLNDRELVSLYIKGNEQALEFLVNRYQDKLIAYIITLTRDYTLSEDIFQETFFRAITTLKKGDYNEEGKFYPWVRRIAYNLVIDQYREKVKFPTVTGGDDYDIFDILPIRQGNVEDKMIKKQVRDDLRGLIKLLPADQREVLIMRLYQGMSFKEIAAMLNISINTALGRMRYAVINLRKMIDKKKLVLT